MEPKEPITQEEHKQQAEPPEQPQKKPRRTVRLRSAVIVGAAAALLCSALSGAAVYSVMHPDGVLGELYDALLQADAIREAYFVGEDYTDEDLIDYTLTGYAAGLGDRWTSYLSPKSYQSYLDSTADSTVGIGVTVSYVEEEDSSYLYVNSVAHESPAEEAGIGYYDKIVTIEGKTVEELGGYDEAVEAVRGEAGESVTLGIQPYGSDTTEEITITRAEYEQIHVVSRMLENNIGYIAIEKFTDQTDEQFDTAVEDMLEQGAEKLIFDLRGNPGGQLTALANCLDTLLPEGTIISLQSKSGDTEEYTSDADAVDVPMAVLINEESYSAAEFFAAALQEYDKAEIVGEQTVGKGYSQQGFELSNGGYLNISTNCYYTPKGESLIGKGVVPDYEVTLSEEKEAHLHVLTDEEDDQLQAAISALE